MASIMAREITRSSYVSPAVVMYLRDDDDDRGSMFARDGDTSDEEEEEATSCARQPAAHAAGAAAAGSSRRAVGGGAARQHSDSAYSTASLGGRRSGGRAEAEAADGRQRFAAMDADECASTTSSSVPLDPATQVPVFLVPPEMEFVVAGDSPDTRKVLTLYNPYDYGFQYRILCTAPEHYMLQKPSGMVGAKRVVEIPIRGLPSLQPSMQHRIKVEIRRIGQTELLGSRVVNMRSVAFATPVAAADAAAASVYHRMGGAAAAAGGGVAPTAAAAARRDAGANEGQQGMNLSLMIIVSGLCLLALCLPIQKDTTTTESLIPLYLHISETQRVVAAFILGVCSVLILQPNNR